MKLCTKCGEKPRRKHGTRCLDCHAADQSKRGKTPRETWSPERKRKESARSLVRTYVRRGKIARMPCKVCGQVDRVEAHHHLGYDYPLHVEWYCRKHHMEVHEKEGYDHDLIEDSHVKGHRQKAMDKTTFKSDAKKEARTKRKLFGGRDAG